TRHDRNPSRTTLLCEIEATVFTGYYITFAGERENCILQFNAPKIHFLRQHLQFNTWIVVQDHEHAVFGNAYSLLHTLPMKCHFDFISYAAQKGEQGNIFGPIIYARDILRDGWVTYRQSVLTLCKCKRDPRKM